KLSKGIELRSSDAEIKISALGAAISSYRYRGPLGFVELIVDPSVGMFSTWPNLAFYQTSAETPGYTDNLKDAKPNPMVHLEAKLPSGLIIDKVFGFSAPGLLDSLRMIFHNPTKNAISVPSWDIQLGPGLGTVESEQSDNAKIWRAIGLFPP